MVGNFLFVTIFVYTFVLMCNGEDCETYDGNGLCIERCTNGRQLYAPGCLDLALTERTCRQPTARPMGMICDYYRCECPSPKVWDEVAKKCVNVKECTKKGNRVGVYY